MAVLHVRHLLLHLRSCRHGDKLTSHTDHFCTPKWALAIGPRGKVKNIRLSTLRDNQMSQNPKSCVLNFEKETEAYDDTMTNETQCKR